MATIGKIGEFDPEKEDWPSYVEQLGHFFTANGIDEEARKKAVFLSVIGPSAYKLTRSLVSPRKPGDLEYKDLVDTMTKHYNPVPSRSCKGTSSIRVFGTRPSQLLRTCQSSGALQSTATSTPH